MKKLARLSVSAPVLIIFFLGFLVYANSLANGFVWNDEEQVVNNLFIRSRKNLPVMFSGGHLF